MRFARSSTQVLVALGVSAVGAFTAPSALALDLDSFNTFDDINAWMDEFAVIHGAMVQDYGVSFEGRPLRALSLGSADGRPAILFTAAQSGPEWSSAMMVVNLADQLVEAYGDAGHPDHARVVPLMDAFQILIVPVVNPDGYHYTWTSDATWRKNRNASYHGACVGVDLDRNWDQCWGDDTGSSADPCSGDFRGPSALSEPETSMLGDFIVAHGNIVAHIDYHSLMGAFEGGTTTNGSIVAPTGIDGCASAGISMRTIARAMNGFGSRGYTTGLASDVLGPMSGIMIDWCHVQQGIRSFRVDLKQLGSPPWSQTQNYEANKETALSLMSYQLNPEVVSFGVVNRPLGGAVLSDDGEGRLIISNIGESGKDGFVARVGDAERIDMEVEEQDAASLQNGDRFSLTAAGTVDGVRNVDVGTLRAEVTDGEFLLTPDDTAIGATSYTMRLEAADGTVVYEETNRSGPAVRMARWTLFYRKKYPDGTVEWCIGRREAQAMTVAGGGTFDAAMVTMRAEAPSTPVEWVNDLQVRPRGVPQIVVFNEGLGLNGLCHTGLGSGRLEGIEGNLFVDNIGASGLDGVSGSDPRVSRVEIGVVEQDAVQYDAGAGFSFTARGEAGGSSDVEIGTLRADVTGGDFLLTPDDSAIGSTSYTLQLRDENGTLLYEETGRGGPAVTARRFSLFYRVKYPDGTVEWCIGGSPQAMRIVDGPTFEAAMVTMRAEVPDVAAPGSGGFTPVDAITGVDITGRSVPGITITSETFEPIVCQADLDRDDQVGVADLLLVLSAWGACPGCPEDFDGNGEVEVSDLLVVLADWGPCN